QLKQFASGRRVRAQGEARGGLFGLEIVHPRWRLVDEGEALPDRLTPVYSTVAGIGQAKIRAAVLTALRRLDWPETVPPDVRRRPAAGRVAVPADRRSAARLARDRHRPGAQPADESAAAGRRRQRQDGDRGARRRAGDRQRLAGRDDGPDRAARRTALAQARAV